MIDRFEICNNWNYFHNDVENIKANLIKNAYPPFLIDKVIKKYLDYKFSSNPNQLKDKSDVHCFKFRYIGNLSHHIKDKLSKICEEFCKENFNIKLVFNSFKVKNYFSYKHPISYNLKSFLLYKFNWASCNSSYIGETCRHFKNKMMSTYFSALITLHYNLISLQHTLYHIFSFYLLFLSSLR